MTSPTLPNPTVEGVTERFDPIEVLDESVRRRAESAEPQAPGRYVEVHGTERTLTIPIGDDAVRIGRGLGADLRLDDTSVSRRHAILAPGASGVRILDDRPDEVAIGSRCPAGHARQPAVELDAQSRAVGARGGLGDRRH